LLRLVASPKAEAQQRRAARAARVRGARATMLTGKREGAQRTWKAAGAKGKVNSGKRR